MIFGDHADAPCNDDDNCNDYEPPSTDDEDNAHNAIKPNPSYVSD